MTNLSQVRFPSLVNVFLRLLNHAVSSFATRLIMYECPKYRCPGRGASLAEYQP